MITTNQISHSPSISSISQPNNISQLSHHLDINQKELHHHLKEISTVNGNISTIYGGNPTNFSKFSSTLPHSYLLPTNNYYDMYRVYPKEINENKHMNYTTNSTVMIPNTVDSITWNTGFSNLDMEEEEKEEEEEEVDKYEWTGFGMSFLSDEDNNNFQQRGGSVLEIDKPVPVW